jgi:hypothetical protein
VASAVAAAAVPGAAMAAGADRAYELVSPADKGSSDVLNGVTGTADGNAVVYNSYGTFGGAPSVNYTAFYRSERTAGGWTTTTLSPTQTDPVNTSLSSSIGPQDFSTDLRTMWVAPLFPTKPLVPEDVNASAEVYASTLGGEVTWQSRGVDPAADGDSLYGGRSDDGRHVVFESYKQILPDVPGGTSQLYEIVDGTTRLVSVIGGAPASADARLGAGRGATYFAIAPDRRAVSADGSHVFFNSGGELYARIDGRRTVMLSASRVGGHEGEPSGGAQFEGAADDGHLVTFTSAAALTDDASAGGGLYSYDLRDDRLHLLADAPSFAINDMKTTPDGERIYFQTATAIGGVSGTTGANLWVARTDGSDLHLVGGVDPGDSALWGHGENYNAVAVSPDSRRVAFASAANLTSYDSGGMQQVYVYDAVARKVTCASCPPDGAPATGLASLHNPEASIPTAPRNFTDDGRLFFETPQALVAADDDAKADVYELGPDGVRLVTPATSVDAHFIDNSADGSTVFVLTRAGLVRADVDGGNADIYAVRVGGGFPDPPAPCAGVACRGPESPLPVGPPGAGTTTALDPTPGTAPQKATTFKVSSISAAARRRLARTGSLTVRVRVSDTAVLTATGRGQIGKKRTTVASGRTHRLGAGRVTLKVRLTSAARKALRRSGRLTVRLAIACSDTKRVARSRLVLRTATKTTKKKTTKKKAAR